MPEYDRDLTSFYDPDLLLPIGGRKYRIKCPGVREADRLRWLVLDGNLSARDELAEIVKILGPAREEMADHGVPDTMVLHAGRTALLHYGGSPALGAANWRLAALGDLVDIQRILDAGTAAQEAPGD